MRVLLIYPTPPQSHWPRGSFRSRWVPTGLAYLAASLRKAGHEVRVHVREEQLITNGLDWADADARLRELLVEFSPEMVGLSMTTATVPEAARLAKMARALCGDGLMLVAGGPHPTAVPELTLRDCPHLDVIVIGEGEQTVVELAARGISADVAGLAYRQDGTVLRSQPRDPPTDLDALGPPAYDLFNMDFYTSPSRWLVRWLPLAATNIRTSRGCVNRCRFCAGHLVAGLGVRHHSVEYVMDQIHRVVDTYGVEAIRFEDDSLGADRGRLLAICERLRQSGLARKIKWDCCLRVDQAEAEVLAAMKSAGCIQVEYGFESGSDAALKRIAKNATVEANRRAVLLTRQAGLRIFADIMMGLPGETAEDIKATIDFLRWARPEVISAAVLSPIPGTAIYDQLPPETRNSMDWAAFSYLDPPSFDLNLTAMPDEQFKTAFRRFRKYLIRPQQLWSLLRDTPHDRRAVRRRLAWRLAKFALRHPIRAARVPR